MANFKKYLVVSTETSSLSRDEFVLDRVAWGDLTKIKNLNDYDEIIINLNAAFENPPTKTFSQFQIQIDTVFNQASWMHVMLSGGRIFVVGKPNSTFTATNASNNIVQVQPLQALLDLTEDLRPLDYRRVNRNLENENKSIYKYLDSVSTWNYSLTNIGINNYWRHALQTRKLEFSFNRLLNNG